MSCKLFLTNNKQSQEKNLQLMKFLNNNVQELVGAGFVIHIIKVTSKNLEELRRSGIHATPALQVKGTCPVIGSKKIMRFFIDSCETPKEKEAPRRYAKEVDVSIQEDVKDLLFDIIKDYSEDDEDEISKEQVKARVAESINSRTKIEDKKTVQISKDDAMDKYWENMEETQI